MFGLTERLESLLASLRDGAGSAADVLDKFGEAIGAAGGFLRDVSGGKVFSAAATEDRDAETARLKTVEAEFKKLAKAPAPAAKGKTKAAAAANPNGLDPATIVAIAKLVLELVRAIRERRPR